MSTDRPLSMPDGLSGDADDLPSSDEVLAKYYAEHGPIFSAKEARRSTAKLLRRDAPSAQAPVHLPLIWARHTGALVDASYVIKGIIGPGELVVIYGAPKSGKTFLATDLALCVATGQEWFGNRVNPGLVIYIAAEMGHRAQRRVRAWLDHHLGNAVDGDTSFAIVPRVVNLLDELDVERLFATLESLAAERGVPVLIVIDTLSRSMVGGDENAAQDMGRAIAVADRLRDQFNAATAFVHHSGKDVTKGSRGSSALLGAADTYIRIESDDQGNRLAEVEWSRDGEAGRQYPFRLRVVELGQDADGDLVTTCVVESGGAPLSRSAGRSRTLPAPARVALDALSSAIADCGELHAGIRSVRVDHWREAFDAALGAGPLSDDKKERRREYERRHKAFSRATERLVADGLVVFDGDFAARKV